MRRAFCTSTTSGCIRKRRKSRRRWSRTGANWSLTTLSTATATIAPKNGHHGVLGRVTRSTCPACAVRPWSSTERRSCPHGASRTVEPGDRQLHLHVLGIYWTRRRGPVDRRIGTSAWPREIWAAEDTTSARTGTREMPSKPATNSCWETPPGPAWTRPLCWCRWGNGSSWRRCWIGLRTCIRSRSTADKPGRPWLLQPVPSCRSRTLAIGWDIGVNNFWFHGTIDEVRIYNKALSNEEVAWLAGG